MHRRLLRRKKKRVSKPSGLDEMKTNNLTVNLLSFDSIYYMALVLFSILGVLHNASWFAFHMLHIANQNQLIAQKKALGAG